MKKIKGKKKKLNINTVYNEDRFKKSENSIGSPMNTQMFNKDFNEDFDFTENTEPNLPTEQGDQIGGEKTPIFVA